VRVQARHVEVTMVHPRQNRIAKENWALGHDSPGDLDWTNSLCRHDRGCD
jgi:hypothetical protein